MADAKERVISVLSTTLLVDMNTNTKRDLFIFPQKGIVTEVHVHTLSDTVALGSNNDFGDGAGADTWKTDVDLSAMDGTDDYYVIRNDNTRIEAVFDAGDVFGIDPDEDNDAGGAITATIDVIGRLLDV